MLTVLNQVLRTLLHSRLQLGIQQYQDDPNFQGDIILLEPGETDLAFFKMAPLNLWAGRSAGAHGYLSVTQAIEAHYELIRQILQSYGVLMTRREVREGLERLLRTEPSETPDDVLLRHVAKSSPGAPHAPRVYKGHSHARHHGEEEARGWLGLPEVQRGDPVPAGTG